MVTDVKALQAAKAWDRSPGCGEKDTDRSGCVNERKVVSPNPIVPM